MLESGQLWHIVSPWILIIETQFLLKKAALTPQKSVHMKIFLGEMGKNEGGKILKTVGCVFYRHGWDQNIPLAKKD